MFQEVLFVGGDACGGHAVCLTAQPNPPTGHQLANHNKTGHNIHQGRQKARAQNVKAHWRPAFD
jgi:hypothetical protein